MFSNHWENSTKGCTEYTKYELSAITLPKFESNGKMRSLESKSNLKKKHLKDKLYASFDQNLTSTLSITALTSLMNEWNVSENTKVFLCRNPALKAATMNLVNFLKVTAQSRLWFQSPAECITGIQCRSLWGFEWMCYLYHSDTFPKIMVRERTWSEYSEKKMQRCLFRGISGYKTAYMKLRYQTCFIFSYWHKQTHE